MSSIARQGRQSNLVEIGDGSNVHQVNDGKVLNLFCDRVKGFVHCHALGIPVMTEADDDDAVFFRLDGFVDVPTGGEMREKVRHECRDDKSTLRFSTARDLPDQLSDPWYR